MKMKKVKTLKKICRVRRRLIAEGKSYQKQWLVIKSMQFIESNIDAFENASEDFWEKFIKKHQEKIEILIPKNKAEKTFKNQLGIN